MSKANLALSCKADQNTETPCFLPAPAEALQLVMLWCSQGKVKPAEDSKAL